MGKELEKTLNATSMIEQYDICAKRLFGHKIILANILRRAIDDFKDMEPEEIVSYIEGEPSIGVSPVEPGLTNIEKSGERLKGLNSENSEINEGTIYFDIICYVKMKNGLTQVIINLEIQKNKPKSYNLLNRAVFYVSRLISSQKERDFVNSDYDDIKQVYSIWICLGMKKSFMSHFYMSRDDIVGMYELEEVESIPNVIIIGLPKKLEWEEEESELHKFLEIILSDELNAKTKMKMLESDFGIENKKSGEEVNEMCNLGEGIFERGIDIGRSEGIDIGRSEGVAAIIRKLHENGLNAKKISDLTGKSVSEVDEILQGAEVNEVEACYV